MKRIIAFAFAALIVASLLAVTPVYAEKETVGSGYINVYNWGEYIADGVNEKFTELTGITVNYTNYASNEDMYAKLKSGGASYDIVIPSDYMIERLIAEDMLEKLDFSNIPNYENILDEYKGLYFDPNDEYSVPYNAGMVGLIYNTKLVDEAPTSWSVMWDEKYSGKILTFDNPRDVFAIAQFLLGIDINSTDTADWDRAAEKLKEQKPLIQSYVMDEVFDKMEKGEAAMAPYYAGDFITMHDENEDLAFVYPKEGTNIFVDSICIPKGTQNKTAAEMYINFLLDPEIALENAEWLGYSSPNKTVVDNDEYSLKGNEIVYPSEEVKKNTDYFHNLPQETLNYMSESWNDIKASGINGLYIYIAIAVIVVVIVAIFILRQAKKKKQSKYMD